MASLFWLKEGQAIAEALLSSDFRTCRKTLKNAPRGVYCGMGICYECRMIVNGTPNVRICMTSATPGCKRQGRRMKETELVIIGGGPAGMSAAIEAADRDISVVLIDENRTIWRSY